MASFVERVRSRRQPICNAEVGCRPVAVCLVGSLAVWNRRRLAPPRAASRRLARPRAAGAGLETASCRLVGDAEANRWLDRPKRGERQKVRDEFA